MSSDSKILVTLANSNFGSLALDYLVKVVPPKNIIGTVRDLKKGEKLKKKGIELRVADYSKPETLLEAFKGIEKILFISSLPGQAVSRDQQHKNVIDAAKKCGVKFIVYTSIANCQKNKSALANDHKITENYLKESGIKHSICRNNWYFENDILIWRACGLEGKNLYNPLGQQKIGYALRKEYAEAAGRILIHKNPKEIYELSPKPLGFKEIGEALKKVSKKDFKIVDVSKDEFLANLKKDGYPEPFVGMWAFIINDYISGCLNFESKDFAEVLGREPASLEDSLKEMLKN